MFFSGNKLIEKVPPKNFCNDYLMSKILFCIVQVTGELEIFDEDVFKKLLKKCGVKTIFKGIPVNIEISSQGNKAFETIVRSDGIDQISLYKDGRLLLTKSCDKECRFTSLRSGKYSLRSGRKRIISLEVK